jgi:hypothetical protein
VTSPARARHPGGARNGAHRTATAGPEQRHAQRPDRREAGPEHSYARTRAPRGNLAQPNPGRPNRGGTLSTARQTQRNAAAQAAFTAALDAGHSVNEATRAGQSAWHEVWTFGLRLRDMSPAETAWVLANRWVTETPDLSEEN